MKKEISQSDIMGAFQKAALAYGEVEIAGKLDIAVSTLSNKLNPYKHAERRHFLNFWEADDILSITGDLTPLMLLAQRHGCRLLPDDIAPNEPTAAEEKASDVQTLAKFQSEKDSKQRKRYLFRHIMDVIQTDKKIDEEEAQ